MQCGGGSSSSKCAQDKLDKGYRFSIRGLLSAKKPGMQQIIVTLQ
jgi:hypothetical protein